MSCNACSGSRPSAVLPSAAPLAAALLAVALVASACASRVTQPDPAADRDRPAVLLSPTPDVRAELAHVVSEALNGAPVRLADDALTTDSHLIITRIERRDAAGHPILGRSTEKPERFDLVERGGRCILIQERTGRRWPLKSATCEPARTQ